MQAGICPMGERRLVLSSPCTIPIQTRGRTVGLPLDDSCVDSGESLRIHAAALRLFLLVLLFWSLLSSLTACLVQAKLRQA